MMKPFKLYILGCAFTLTCVVACTMKNVDVDIPFDTNKIVLNALYQKDSFLYVRLTRPLPILHGDENFEEIKGANVELYDNDLPLGSLAEKDINGRHYYYAAVKGAPGKQYRLKASGTFGEVSAATHIPDGTVITQVDYIKFSSATSDRKMRIAFKHRPGVKTWYYLQIFRNDEYARYREVYFTIDNLRSNESGIFGAFIEPEGKEAQVFTDAEFADKDSFTLATNILE